MLYTEAFTTDFIILDIEFNGRKFASDKPMEVIEIGAVRLNSALQATDEFSALVKPVYFSKLNGFIKSKTGIPQEAIDQAAGFPKVIADFIVWLDRSSAFTLVTWGGEDLKRIIYDTRMHRLDDSYWMSAAYFDLLKGYLRHAKVTNDVSVEAALTELGISTGGSAHRALDDARMTAEIFRTIFGGLDFNQAQHFKDSYTNSKERRMVTNAVRTMYAQNTVPNWDLFVEHFIKDKVSLADPRKAAELQNYFEAAVEKQRGQRRPGGGEDKNLQTTTKSK